VIVDNMRTVDGEVVELTQQELNDVEEGIASILNSMITTSIDKEYGEINADEKVSIVFQTFHGRDQLPVGPDTTGNVIWPYIVAAVVILLIVFVIIVLVRRGRRVEEAVESEEITNNRSEETPLTVPDIEKQPKSEQDIQKDQLEKMAKDKPEDFAKLLRSWISED